MADLVQILPPDVGRANTYATKNFTESKFLYPDGSVWSGLPTSAAVTTNMSQKTYVDGDIFYVCNAPIGSALSDPVWQIEKIERV